MKLKQVIDGEWQLPIMRNYRMACCDCGLVHNIDFRILRVLRTDKSGYHTLEEVPYGKNRLRVQIRGSRNKRSTAQVRRHKVKK